MFVSDKPPTSSHVVSNGMIAYLRLPFRQIVFGQADIFDRLQGVEAWEIDSPRGVYLSLAPGMTKSLIRHVYHALRGRFGPYIRFGAAVQKTTARAAALYRPVPHCTIIMPEMTRQFLAELPIGLLPGLGRRTTEFLADHGVTTFAAFRRLSKKTLKDWFGVSGLILQQFAHGIDPRHVEARRFASA